MTKENKGRKAPIKDRGSSAQSAGKKNKRHLQKISGWALFVLIVVQVVLANSLVTKGREINRLVSERERLRAEVISLENEIAQASSLTAVRRGAEGLGMGPGSIEFLPPPPLAAATP